MVGLIGSVARPTDDRDLPDVDILGGDSCYADGMCRERDYEEKRTHKTTPHPACPSRATTVRIIVQSVLPKTV